LGMRPMSQEICDPVVRFRVRITFLRKRVACGNHHYSQVSSIVLAVS
jgi:hypothetical protein